MDRTSIRQRLISANHDAKACAGDILAADYTNHQLMRALILRYISIRYFLDEDELHTDNLYGLAEAAVAKTLAIKREKLADVDIPGTCTGTSSAASKKILLLLALCRDLGIPPEPEQAVRMQTVDQLACYVELTLQGHPAPKEE